MSEQRYPDLPHPGLEAVARRWHSGPNAALIRRLHGQFLRMPAPLQELFLFGLDIEEGALPLIHVHGYATRSNVTNDDRLIAGGGTLDYRELIAAAEHASASTAPAEAAASGSPDSSESPAEASEAARPARSGIAGTRGLEEVVWEDKPGMAAYFPQFRHWRVGEQFFWRGLLKPLLFAPEIYDLLAVYQSHADAPLQMRVLRPALHPAAPHRYVDGSLCTFYPPLGSWVRGRVDADGDPDDLTALLRFTVTWLVRYKCWLEFGGWWPGIDVPHDPVWLVANLSPDDFCPFHMPARWAACCHAAYAGRAS